MKQLSFMKYVYIVTLKQSIFFHVDLAAQGNIDP